VNRDGWPGPLAVSLSLLLLAGPGAAAGGTGTNPWHANDIMWYANDIDLHTNDIPLPATDPAAPSGSTDADAAIAARLLDAEQALDGGESYAQLWWGGWLGLFSASALGSGAISLVATPSTQPVWRIGALRSALGVASVLAVPFPAAWAPGDLRALPESTPAERKLKLGAALSALHRAAAVERLGRSWLAHAGGLLALDLARLPPAGRGRARARHRPRRKRSQDLHHAHPGHRRRGPPGPGVFRQSCGIPIFGTPTIHRGANHARPTAPRLPRPHSRRASARGNVLEDRELQSSQGGRELERSRRPVRFAFL